MALHTLPNAVGVVAVLACADLTQKRLETHNQKNALLTLVHLC
mgnify:FL=1